VVSVFLAAPASAYIGPGAGFAAAGSVLILLGTFLLAFGIVLLWPVKAVVRVFVRRGKTKPKVKRQAAHPTTWSDSDEAMDPSRDPPLSAPSAEAV
jgi:hypothetical protein